jgi:WD repeat-containing protein 19
LFSVDSRLHGKSSLLSAWQPQSHLVASCGSTRIVFVNDRRGKLIDQITLPLSTACTHLEWNRSGEVLACLQEHASSILLWHCATKQVETVDLQLKEPSFMRWARHADKIAIGGTKGDMVIYDRITKEKTLAAAHLKKRVSCGEWSADGKLAFSSDDRQITIALDTGSTFGQVKVKSKPIKLAFGSNLRTPGRDNIVSVSMDRKSILFYNLDDPENALELAFQQRYGQIVNFHWFRDGFIMVAFTLGFVVVISTSTFVVFPSDFMCSVRSKYMVMQR